jgi:HD-like signal output (HDOD) protein
MPALAPNRESLLQIAQQLPASAQVLVQLNELLTDLNSGLEAVANLLRRDTSLAARIIRISNSVVFGMGGRVDTVEDAVNRVGFSEIYRLTGLAAAAQLGDQHLSFYGINGPQLRDNTLVISLVTEALAQRSGADARVAYTAGLLRSTGKLVLDRWAKRWLPSCPTYFQSGAANLIAWEKANFDLWNSSAAADVLLAWRFPPTIVEPVRHQYSDTGSSGPQAQTSRLLRIACSVAQRASFGLPGEFETAQPSEAALTAAGLSSSAVDESQEEALQSFEQLKSFL